MKSSKSRRRRRMLTTKKLRTPQSERYVRIIAIILGLLVVVIGKSLWLPAQGEYLGASQYLATATLLQGNTAASQSGKIIITTRDGMLHIAQLPDTGAKTDLTAAQTTTLTNMLTSHDVQLSPYGSATTIITHGNISAQTELPLIIDTSDFSYTVETNQGKKQLTHLPGEVIRQLFAEQVIDQVQTLDSTAPTGSNITIKLTQDASGTALFEVRGKKKKKLFGLFPIAITKVVTVSSQTGELLTEKTSFFGGILNTLSF